MITTGKSRFSPQQIVGVLIEFEGGKSAQDVSREHGISGATLYGWRKRYSGMDGVELRRPKSLESGNMRLKRMYSELALDHQLAK
jgi:putative transposase